MTFLHPWALALSALAIVPLALHLVRRDARRRVPFPALRYMHAAERRHARALRLRDRWLVAARIGVLLCLAAAAARPLVGRGGPASHPPTDVTLVVDNTASMRRVAGDRTLLDAALEAARRSVGHATVDDRFWVATPVDGVIAAGVGAAEAATALGAVRGSDAAGSLPAAARAAVSAMPAREGRAREVQLFSDGQASSWEGDAELAPGAAAVLFLVEPDAVANRAVLDLAVHPPSPVPTGTDLVVTVRVGRWPASARDDESAGPGPADPDPPVPVRVLLDGELAAAGRAAPGEEAALAIPAAPPGSHLLRAEIDADGLRADDGRQVGIRVGEPVRVHGPPGAEGGFVMRALETLAGGDRVRLASPGEPADVRVRAGPDAVAVDGGARPPALVVVPPSDPLDLPAFLRSLSADGIPWSAEPEPGRGELRLVGEVEGLAGVRVRRRYRLRPRPVPPTPFDSVLVRAEDGEPWAIRGRAAGGRPFVLLGSALVPDATDLPVSVAMVPFVDALVGAWARPGSAPAEREAGAETTLPDRADSLTAPGAPARRVEGGAPWRPREAGAWRVALGAAPDGARSSEWVGVNVPGAESDPAPASDATLAAALGVDEVSPARDAAAWDAAAFARRRGREARIPLLALALLLLAAEAVLAAPGGRARFSGRTRTTAAWRREADT